LSQDKQFFSIFFAIMGGLTVLAIALILIATNLTTDVADYKPEALVLDNIKPVGRVNVAGESAPEQDADPAPVETAAAPKSGEDIYNGSCMGCHATGAAGAPKLGDAAAWAPRIAAGMASLMSNATNGLNAMPPKGLCMSCSDDEMKAVVEYMVNNSQ
jgi:cytochrome c5